MTAKGVDRTAARAAGACLTWLLLVSAAGAQSAIRLRDATAESGIAFRHTDGSGGHRYIVETVASGLATLDYDGDGLTDVYFLNGAPLKGTPWTGPPPRNALYRNLGSFRFEDVTEKSGVGDTGHGLGVAAADFDNDGHVDLYVSNYGPKILYRNNGDGTFTDVTRRAGVADGSKVGAGACFLDADGDGNLDLYVANYVRFTYESHVPRTIRGVPMYHGPRDYDPSPATFFRNNGDGTFADLSKESGIASVAGTGMGTICFDCDADGDTDVFVCNDVRANFLFLNDGTGKFVESGLVRGVAYNFYGQANGSMGADCGDFDRDGWLDLFMTDYQNELPVLYKNLGNGFFEDFTLRTGAGAGSLPYVKWGTGFVDFDNDGDLDLFLACGHIQDNIEQVDDSTAYETYNVLLENVGGKFVDVSAQCGLRSVPKRSARGAAFDDLDNDGRIDVVVLNSRREPTILRNETANGNHFLDVRLQGVKSNRDGVGAQVTVIAGDLIQRAEVHSGRGYQGHFGTRLHFGLGKRQEVDRIEVRWLGGGLDVLLDVPADRLLTIREGTERGTERRQAHLLEDR